MKANRIIISLLLSTACLLANAQDGAEKALGKFITLSVSHENGQYRKGENIKVFADLKDSGYGDLRMDLLYNGIIKESRRLKLEEGTQCILDTCYRDTRAVIVSLYSEKVSPHTLDIGFVIAPKGFRPGFEAPEDLKEYWDGQVSAWKQSQPRITATPVKFEGDRTAGYDCWDIEISCPEGRPVRGYLAMPSGAKPASLPILIKSCAAGVSGNWCRVSPKEAVNMAEYGGGCMAFVLNAHGFPNDAPLAYYKELENGELFEYSVRHITTRQDYYFRTMFLRMERALDYLCTRPEWDRKRVLAYGESQGGAQAAALAGIDSRVSAIVLNVPAMVDLGGLRAGRSSGWPKVCEREPDNLAVDYVAPYFDAALLLHLSKAEIFCDIGLIDRTCPASGVFAGLNNARGKVHVVTYPRRPHHEPYDKAIHEDFARMILTPRQEFLGSYLRHK